MGYRQIIRLVNYGNLSADQRSKLKKVLQERRTNLQKALAEVDDGLKQLGSKAKKASKRKAAKRRK